MNKMMSLFYLVGVAGLFLNPALAESQTDPQYCVFEQNDRTKVAGRIDWLSVAKCSDSAGIAGAGWVQIEGPMTYTQATILVDALRVNLGRDPSGESDRFHKYCDHNYVVWKNTAQQPATLSYSKADANPGLGYILERSNLCCEDAVALAFPETLGINDCRAFELMSVPGTRVTLAARSWVSLSGPARINHNPPIDIPSMAGASILPALGKVWNESENGWKGVWTRVGDTKDFNAVWTLGTRKVTGKLSIVIDNNGNVSVQRGASDNNNCTYEGRLAEDGITVSGTYSCSITGTSLPWTATIER